MFYYVVLVGEGVLEVGCEWCLFVVGDLVLFLCGVVYIMCYVDGVMLIFVEVCCLLGWLVEVVSEVLYSDFDVFCGSFELG